VSSSEAGCREEGPSRTARSRCRTPVSHWTRTEDKEGQDILGPVCDSNEGKVNVVMLCAGEGTCPTDLHHLLLSRQRPSVFSINHVWSPETGWWRAYLGRSLLAAGRRRKHYAFLAMSSSNGMAGFPCPGVVVPGSR
jgi:hypothetical protein